MKITIIGGSGLIGSRLVKILRARHHEVLAAARNSGVDILTGQGLPQAMTSTRVVVDVSNSPSFEDTAVLRFFETSTRNLLHAAADAGVSHYVALSIVGADRLPDSGYMRAKVAQETLIRSAHVPYTILRATQFFEFTGGIADSGAERGTIRLPVALMQPLAADDVAAALADVAVGIPANGTLELAGPEKIPMDELVRRFLSATGDARQVIGDAHAKYFGTELTDQSLTPGPNPRLAPTRFDQWLSQFQMATA
jgi:uncharacterized protein YbjT (DUF2867 family)